MNNADLTVKKIREAQQVALDRNTSPDTMFRTLEILVAQANKASAQINALEETLNRMINALNEKGLFNSEVVKAYTNNQEAAEKIIEVINSETDKGQ